MILQLALKIEGEFIDSDKRAIRYRDPRDGRLIRILKPDILTLQIRTGDGTRDTIVARVFDLKSLEERTVEGGQETPQQYVERLYGAYQRISKKLADPNREVKLSDIRMKIEKVCSDKQIPDPLQNT